MMAGKVRLKMETPKADIQLKSPLSSPSYTYIKAPQKSLFSRSFGKIIARSSGQLQPPSLDLTELLRLVEELRDRESRLKTELLEHKLLKESLAIVPVLENEIYLKETEIERALIRIDRLKAENERLKKELDEVKSMADEETQKSRKMIKMMEEEIMKFKKMELVRPNAKPTFDDDEHSASQRFQRLMEDSVKSNLISNVKEREKCINRTEVIDSKRGDVNERPNYCEHNSEELDDSTLSYQIFGHSLVPISPPRQPFLPSDNSTSKPQSDPKPPPAVPVKPVSQPSPPLSTSAPPPPPPPPIEKRLMLSKVRRVPEVVEFYHSLMRRDSRKDCSPSVTDAPTSPNARDMIGEIENRSAHLLAIKSDVETKGEFIKLLIKEVENAAFKNIEDVVSFVKWLDDELSYLVDERAVLKHFEWPEQKADALREAAFGFSDLKKLELEASSFHDDGRQPRDIALKKMQAMLEKLEYGVYSLSRMRESATMRYKLLQVPVDWMLDTGIVSQIKLQSLKLAVKYLKRVSIELDTVYGCSEEDYLIIQGAKSAFRVHQFAGGFDMETLRAFQELKQKVKVCQD